MTNNKNMLYKGDWIKGKSLESELIIGFVESIEALDETVSVTVVKSDNKDLIGKTIQMLRNRVKGLPISKVSNKNQIQFLIDLALATGDEEWFNELTSRLNSMRQLVSGEF